MLLHMDAAGDSGCQEGRKWPPTATVWVTEGITLFPVCFDLLPLINSRSNDPLLMPALPTTLGLPMPHSSTLAPGAVTSCQMPGWHP